ncbi:DUF4158 domain-containing protein [Bacillus cereus group sp. BfR-BA-01331]|uniref:DUF4158 domain-containing protein n=1 Tax=Bacillus cereus group sp. BfR-BA-01331 TaxID=2920307 RepID=UPI0024135719|nr:DUF4158 domain-containing protein [Bacillus cereus group sp. BfR-BA-01331]
MLKTLNSACDKLGFALQLCVLRFPCWTLSDVQHIPDCVVNYIAKQLQINANEIHIYAEREQTKHEHLEEIRREYGFRNFTIREYRVVSQVLLQYALENGNVLHLIQIAIEELRKEPAMVLPHAHQLKNFITPQNKKS